MVLLNPQTILVPSAPPQQEQFYRTSALLRHCHQPAFKVIDLDFFHNPDGLSADVAAGRGCLDRSATVADLYHCITTVLHTENPPLPCL